MYDPTRHTALSPTEWDASLVRLTIQQIVSDAEATFDAESFWPAHPLDEHVPDGSTGLYCGAAGVIWAMDFLRREGVTHELDFRPILPVLLDRNRQEFSGDALTYGIEPQRASLLQGDIGVLLLMMRVTPEARVADELYRRIEINLDLPTLELMWGFAGAMLACVFASEMTGESRWRSLYQAQAGRLLAELEETASGPIWTKTLYGRTTQTFGSVHGFAGNMLALIRGWDWLPVESQKRLRGAIPRTLGANALRSGMEVNWPVGLRRAEPALVQHCHGAAGIVTVFADHAVAAPELRELLEDAGRLVWRAGPLLKGSNLCHGTGGNGYAFLKLHALTGEPGWLDRARAFAMAAMGQYRDARARYGQGRFSLWTGDVGLAVYLHDCLTAAPRFPTTDIF